MFRVNFGGARRYFDGLSRRSFLQVGVAGMGAAGLGRVLQARTKPLGKVSRGATPPLFCFGSTAVRVIWTCTT